jgi:hypothetical protein
MLSGEAVLPRGEFDRSEVFASGAVLREGERKHGVTHANDRDTLPGDRAPSTSNSEGPCYRSLDLSDNRGVLTVQTDKEGCGPRRGDAQASVSEVDPEQVAVGRGVSRSPG